MVALATARALPAQVAPNRSAVYLFPSDVQDTRALWVNPAALAILREASVGFDVTVGNPGALGRLEQFTLGLNSRGLSFGYQRDIFDNGVRGNTYRIGLAGASHGLAAGAAAALYRGQTSELGWEFGLTYMPQPMFRFAAVLVNVGAPVVRGFKQETGLVPSITFIAPAAGLSASAMGTVLGGPAAYAFGLAWRATGSLPLGLLARMDTDGSLRRGAFAFGLSFGRGDQAGLVGTTPGDLSSVDAATLYGVSSRSPSR